MRNLLVLFSIILLSQSYPNAFVTSEKNISPYTDKEINAVGKFRPLVEQHLSLDFQRTNAYLLRWLRIRSFDVSGAAEELKKNHQWRKKNRIDSILDKDDDYVSFPRDLPYTVDSVDRAGSPVVIFTFGKWNIRKCVITGKFQSCVRYNQRMYEIAVRKTFDIAEREGKDLDQIYVISDMIGYSTKTHVCAACIPLMVECIRSFATGVWPFAKNVTVINNPRIFEPVINIAKSIITALPVNSYDTDKSIWKEALLKDIAPDQLPLPLGGTKRTKLSSQKGTTEANTN